MTYTLLSEGSSNAKTAKELDGLLAAILYMTPDERTCPAAAENCCLIPCLNWQGRTKMFPAIGEARTRRRELFFNHRDTFMSKLIADLATLSRKAHREGLKAVVRLDGTSDLGLGDKLSWQFPHIMFYDYTKVWPRFRRWLAAPPANRHLTFSLGAANHAQAFEALHNGSNVAVPFDVKRGHKLPDECMGYPVIDGDVNDWRWRDPSPVIVGLRAKGDSAARETRATSS